MFLYGQKVIVNKRYIKGFKSMYPNEVKNTLHLHVMSLGKTKHEKFSHMFKAWGSFIKNSNIIHMTMSTF